jgi:allantoate deiminase
LSDAATVLERCDRLAGVSEDPDRLTRRYGTAALEEARELVAGWMREAGLEPRVDAVGNLIGRRGEGPAFVLGSHLDSVVDAGRYDGPLGVLVGIACAERVAGIPLEVVAFADEEGVRYGTAYLGSAALAGRFDPAWPALRDADGIALGDLLRGDPASAARDPAELLGYLEVHIEQGPVLERLGEPVGAVTAITGQSHAEVELRGRAGHAGTVPMEGRQDALCAAAELVLAAEALARGGAVATVGKLAVAPGARNVIPAHAALTVDVRHGDDAARRATVGALRERAEEIAAARGVGLEWRPTAELEAVPMDERLTRALGPDLPRLASGAGHDAAMMASLAPAAMLFVRCRGGISHHPDESVSERDVAVAIEVVERVLHGL